jgi:hypothetical protein
MAALAVLKRVQQPARGKNPNKQRAPIVPTDEYNMFASEFAEMMVPKELAGRIEPYGNDQVMSKQTRPNQKQLFQRYLGGEGGPHEQLRCFIKKEPYNGCADPRVITPVDVATKIEYLGFIHAFCDEVAKKAKWYASGMTPNTIATRVAGICSNAEESITPSDYSRFDGHVQPIVRIAAKACLIRAFKPEHKDRLLRLYNGVTKRRANLDGVKYDIGFCQASGSPDTSVAASIENAFMHYVAFRKMGLSQKKAYAALGVYLGDDGLTADIDLAVLTQVSKRCGHVLKANVVPRGDLGVNFLSRFYGPGVWNGNPNSCIDIARQLRKFHVTAKMDVDSAVKLGEKALSLWYTDRDTPAIATLVRRSLELLQINPRNRDPLTDRYGLRSWSSKAPLSNQYPNTYEPWMMALLEEQLPGFDLNRLRKFCRRCKSVEQFLTKMPLCVEPEMPEAKSYDCVTSEGDVEAEGDDDAEDLCHQVEVMEKLRDKDHKEGREEKKYPAKIRNAKKVNVTLPPATGAPSGIELKRENKYASKIDKNKKQKSQPAPKPTKIEKEQTANKTSEEKGDPADTKSEKGPTSTKTKDSKSQPKPSSKVVVKQKTGRDSARQRQQAKRRLTSAKTTQPLSKGRKGNARAKNPKQKPAPKYQWVKRAHSKRHGNAPRFSGVSESTDKKINTKENATRNQKKTPATAQSS